MQAQARGFNRLGHADVVEHVGPDRPVPAHLLPGVGLEKDELSVGDGVAPGTLRVVHPVHVVSVEDHPDDDGLEDPLPEALHDHGAQSRQHVHAVPVDVAEGRLEGLGVQPDVRIGEEQPLGRLVHCKGGLSGALAGPGLSKPALRQGLLSSRDHRQRWVVCRKACQHLARAVGAAVVKHHHTHAWEVLGQCGPHAGLDVADLVSGRNDDGHPGRRGGARVLVGHAKARVPLCGEDLEHPQRPQQRDGTKEEVEEDSHEASSRLVTRTRG